MIQDQQLLSEFHELPAESQSELIDFMRFLKQKHRAGQSNPQSETPEQRRERLAQAADLMRQWQDVPLPQEEQEIWDLLEQEGIPPVSCN